jgi:MHS family proline/betaine transporter-like MFS transporter
MKYNTSSTRTVFILSFGTFLEYFDLYLYVHLSHILNNLFFRIDDAKSESLLSAFALCSTFIFRPIGAVIFGYIGDRVGRKFTIFITTGIMGFTCFVMFITPTYASIGIYASIIVTLCRIVQGMASVGELIGAELYITETMKPPKVYVMSTYLVLAWTIGGSAAIMVSILVIKLGINWRYIFLFAAMIGLIGLIIRNFMLEAPGFVASKSGVKQNIQVEKLQYKDMLAYFFMQSLAPIAFYIAFVHCPLILKSYNFTVLDILIQSFIVSISDIISCIFIIIILYRFHPIKILQFLSVIYIPFIVFFIWLASNYESPLTILIFQIFIICFTPTTCPANPIIYKSFPTYKRFRLSALIFTMTNSVIYLIISFGTSIMTGYYRFYGILLFIIPLLVGYIISLKYFNKKLESIN